MGDNMNVLLVMAVIAMYHEKGLIEAIKYALAQGMTTGEVVDLIAEYDKLVERIHHTGTLH